MTFGSFFFNAYSTKAVHSRLRIYGVFMLNYVAFRSYALFLCIIFLITTDPDF